MPASSATRPSAAAPSGAQEPVARGPGQDPRGERRRQHALTDDQRHIRRRRLGDVPVEGERDRVVGAGPLRLELGVDVIGPRDGLHRRQRVGWVAAAGGDRPPGRRARGPPRPTPHVRPGLDDDRRRRSRQPGRQQAAACRCAARLTVIRTAASSGALAATVTAIAAGQLLVGPGHGDRRGCPARRGGAPGGAPARWRRRAARGASRRGRRRAGSRGRRRAAPARRRHRAGRRPTRRPGRRPPRGRSFTAPPRPRPTRRSPAAGRAPSFASPPTRPPGRCAR